MKQNLKMSFKNIILAALVLFTVAAPAQEVLTGFNHQQEPMRFDPYFDKGMSLPFFDDFSQNRVYPDTSKWGDRNVFVNNGVPMLPPNRNAAIFDVLDESGAVYDFAISNPFVADILTSQPIRLDSITEGTPKALSPADSVVFSFFYQPQGHGFAPEASDSLVLQFGYITSHDEEVDSITTVTVIDTVWHHVWSTKGMTLNAFLEQNDSLYYEYVAIPIVDTTYFVDKFLFRFYNYASIINSSFPTSRGTEDNWSIDMVHLDCNRSTRVNTYPKVCFSGSDPSFLSRYRSMPYRQYRVNATQSMSENLDVKIANLDSIQHQINYSYTVSQVGGGQYYRYEANPVTAMPYKQVGFLACDGTTGAVACPYVGGLFNIDYNVDSASFVITHYVSDSSCNPPIVDSMVYHQGLYNYYAYDDGTPELSYGLATGNECFAMQFTMATPDTIAGVQMLFNRTLNDANDKYFDIVVWRDSDGKPGQEFYRQSNCHPRWSEHPYKFAYYEFDEPVRMPGGVFYVGLMQQNNDIINIGVDANNDNQQYIFYTEGNIWYQSSIVHGSLMIRPVVGKSYYIGMDEQKNSSAITLFPNPARNMLHIALPDNAQGATIMIYDVTGRLALSQPFGNDVDVSSLTDGFYIVNVVTRDGLSLKQKLMIER